MPETVKARPLTFQDVSSLYQRGDRLDVLRLDHIYDDEPFLVPATLTVATRRHPGRDRNGTPVYPIGPKGRVLTDQGPLGFKVETDTVNQFGAHQDATLFTTPAAEARYLEGLAPGSRPDRERLYVPDSRGRQFPLAPVYGSMFNVVGFVRGVDPNEALAVVRKALAEAFPAEAALDLPKVQSRPVLDHRVDVYTSASMEPQHLVAEGILSAAAGHSVNASSWHTRTVPKSRQQAR